MKKGIVVLIVVLVVLAILIAVPVSSYNRLVTEQADVEEQRANIMTQLQRRIDLIPNLIQTVNNYTTHETEVFNAVTQARTEMMSAQTMPEMAEANGKMSTALSGLFAVAEAYPELTSNTVYIGLMDELAGTENRIAVERTRYNESVKSYNLAIRRFPGMLFAKLFGFEAAEYFEADEAALSVPEVS